MDGNHPNLARAPICLFLWFLDRDAVGDRKLNPGGSQPLRARAPTELGHQLLPKVVSFHATLRNRKLFKIRATIGRVTKVLSFVW